MVAQASGGAGAVGALERREATPGDSAGPLELAIVVTRRLRRRGQGRLDQRRRDTARPELRAQARRPIPSLGAGGDPVAGEGLVVEIATGAKVGDHVVGDGRGRAPALEPCGEIAGGPGVA